MTEERLLEILSEDNDGEWEGDNALQGLNIIAKYFKNGEEILTAAEHDQIFSVGISEIVAAGISEEDAKELRRLNWMEDYDALACYV